jgi:GMP synthase (glutamine-hydrolysing)
MKSALVIRHLAFEDLGTLSPLLQAQGYRLTTYDAGVDELWKVDLDQVDLLIVLGGPIGAGDEDLYPFLDEEVDLVRRRLVARRPILGICLGAQLMARALGASVSPMAQKEICFSPLRLTDAGAGSSLAALTPDLHVLHWHGDQFDMPEGAVELASTEKCPNQAFEIERFALALQFHIELDHRRFEQWLIGHSAELSAARVDPRELRAQARMHGPALARAAEQVLRSWLDRLVEA